MIDDQNDILYGFQTDGNRRYVIPLKAGVTTYTTRALWSALGMTFDYGLKRWYTNWRLSELVMQWSNRQLAEINARLARERREYEQRMAREAEERRRREDERQQQLAQTLKRIQQLSAQARLNPTALNEAERLEYDRLREYPGVPTDQYPSWETLYNNVYAEIRRKIRESETLNKHEGDFLTSVKKVEIDEAIEATRTEIEDQEVNVRLSRMPASSQARDQNIDPFWVAHVVEAVLKLTQELTNQILLYLHQNDLDIATTKVKKETAFVTPLGRLRVFVRNQAAKCGVVFNIYFEDPQLRAIAEKALLEAGYQHPPQIREAKSLIIAMNAVARYLQRTNPDLKKDVREWARERRAHAIFFGDN
jgi:hypothetical protein